MRESPWVRVAGTIPVKPVSDLAVFCDRPLPLRRLEPTDDMTAAPPEVPPPGHPSVSRRGPSAVVIAALAALATIATITTGACASSPHSATVEMDPMTFRVVDDEGSPRVEHMDPEVLFREGGRAFEALDYATAARKYALVHTHFPESRFALVSAFNAGLSFERDGRCAQAIPLYQHVAGATHGSKDAQDAYFRLASCYETLEDWARLEAAAETVLEPHYSGIAVVDRIAGFTLRGLARQRRGALALAERDFKQALELYQHNLEDRALSTSPEVSLAQLQIGEIYRELFASIRFRLPTERMARDLEDKSNFFLMAQSAYLRTLRLSHARYAVVAGYRLGALYEVMYEDMMAAEIPPELNREEVAIYYEELRNRIRPLLIRAIDVYERNLRMGQRFGRTGDDWIRRTEASLARLREVLRHDSSRAVEAELQRAAGSP